MTLQTENFTVHSAEQPKITPRAQESDKPARASNPNYEIQAIIYIGSARFISCSGMPQGSRSIAISSPDSAVS